MTTPTPLPDNRPLCVVTGHPCGSDTVRVGTDCPSTSGRCVHKSQSSFTQQNMTTPTPMECEHGQLARSCEICELKRDLAAALERINKSEADIAAMTTYAKTQQDRALAAEARAEAAEKDAGRYRWLRVQPHADIAACWYMPVLPQDYPVDTPEQRDAAIDAAREGK